MTFRHEFSNKTFFLLSLLKLYMCVHKWLERLIFSIIFNYWILLWIYLGNLKINYTEQHNRATSKSIKFYFFNGRSNVHKQRDNTRYFHFKDYHRNMKYETRKQCSVSAPANMKWTGTLPCRRTKKLVISRSAFDLFRICWKVVALWIKEYLNLVVTKLRGSINK